MTSEQEIDEWPCSGDYDGWTVCSYCDTYLVQDDRKWNWTITELRDAIREHIEVCKRK